MPEVPERPDVAEVTGRDRLVAALRRPSRRQATAAVLLGVLGFAAVVQVRTNSEDDTYRGASQQDLIQLINSQQLAQDRVEQQIRGLETTRDALRNDTAASQAALELARRQAAALGILAGTVPAVGPGIVVTVDGPAEGVGTQELLNGIQELRSAGAEAIQINDSVRLVGASAFSDGPGDSVMIDGKQVVPPFVIDAIGSPSALEQAVFFPEGFAEEVRKGGGEVKVRKQDRVEVTTTRPVTTPQYAEPDEGG
jgi:uncharacterized protein YlxW (UPF0749 family)